MVEHFLDLLVSANVEIPGVAGRVDQNEIPDETYSEAPIDAHEAVARRPCVKLVRPQIKGEV
jgi:hypothetical protein